MKYIASAGGLGMQVLIYLPILFLAVVYPFFLKDTISAATIVAIAGISFAFVHGVLRYGWKGVLILMGFSLVVSFALENASIASGFPFGHYHYTLDGPQIGRAPIIVGPLYFAMGYLSWTVANAALNRADSRLSGMFDRIALPIAASFAMVQWDVVMDPTQSTLMKGWIWHDGGGYFGVPLTNYLGWFLTVWLFYQAFAIVLGKKMGIVKVNDVTERKSYWIAPILLYLLIALSWALPYLLSQGGTIADATGKVWDIQDLQETAVVILLYTMVPTGLFALYRTLEWNHSE